MRKIVLIFAVLILLSFLSPSAFAQTPQISTGLTWLTSSQTSIGNWLQVDTTEYYSTATALDAVYLLDPTNASYPLGFTWMTNQIVSPTDYLSRRIISLKRAGADISGELGSLLLYRNADGGWGGETAYLSDSLDTALALQALKAANYPDTIILYHAINFLTTNQNSDGGWAFVSGGPSNAYVTAIVLRTLASFSSQFSVQSSIDRAKTYLFTKQNTDGGFGSSPSTIYETALSIISLIESGQGGNQPLQNAINYLNTTQLANGSWNDDPYSTALALQALAKVKPNLSIASPDISYTPTVPTTGDTITISAVIRNNGYDGSTATIARFYDGDPNAGGALIGDAALPAITAGGSSTVSVDWTPSAEGVHNISVLVDPANTLEESSKSDNLAIARIKVSVKADLAVQGMTFIPEQASPGKPLETQVKITNLGGLTAENVVVRISIDGALAAEQTVSAISSAQTQTVNFTLQNILAGFHQVIITADPVNTVVEGDETNNSLTRTVDVRNRIDLMPVGAEIFFSPASPKEGETLYIAAAIYNVRENAASNVKVRFYDGDPAAGGTQIGGEQTIASIPGGGGMATDWNAFDTFGRSGLRPIYVVADPLNSIEETDETNNSAVNTVNIIKRPDLIVQDIQFVPTSPSDGNMVQIRASVKNIGSYPSNDNARLKYYLGDPAAGADQLGLDQPVIHILPGEIAVVPMTFNSTGMLGTIQIAAVIDTYNAIDEINETNNVLIKSLTINPSSRPDLAISASDISFSSARPMAGETVNISAQVHNLNNTSVSNVLVRFFDGNPASGNTLLIGNVTIPALGGMSTEKADIAWDLTGLAGKRAVYVRVDPDNAVLETSETNNEASVILKLGLPRSAVPVNLTAQPLNDTDIGLDWQPGPEADAYGITGYNIYRNKLWVNNLTNISKEGTPSASSFSGASTPNMAVDAKQGTYWFTQTGIKVPHYWEDDFPAPRSIKKVAVYWMKGYSAKNYEVQTWDGAQWVTQAAVTGNTQEITVHNFPVAVTTDKIKINIIAAERLDWATAIREAGIYEERTIGGLAYQDKALGPGLYTYSVTAVDPEGDESMPSNEAAAPLGDITPPAPPEGLTATVNGFNISLRWNASADAAGYRVYKQGLNVALKNRGTVTTATSGVDYIDGLNDGSVISSARSQWMTNPPSAMTIMLANEYSLGRIRMLLENGPDNRYYRYLIESSVDGKSWQAIVDRTSGEWRGWQEVTFAQPVSARYIRITGTFCSSFNDPYFKVMEFEAYTQDFAPTTLDTTGTVGYGVLDYFNITEDSHDYYDYLNVTRQPRRFVFTKFNTEENDTLSIYDKDTNLLLASYGGDLGVFVTPPLTAAKYRFLFSSDPERTATGYYITSFMTLGKQTGLTYAETQYQKGSYLYAVSAVDANGNESGLSLLPIPAVINDSMPPAAPRNLAGTAGNKFINLTWTSNAEADLAGYNLYRNGEAAPLNGSAVITANSYKDTDVVNLTTYTYRVTAVDVNGNESTQSAQVSAMPTGFDLAIRQSGTASDIFIMPSQPSIIDTATITALVKNIGTDTINNSKVNFYDGDPASGGVFVGSTVISRELAQNATATAQVTWHPSAEGPHTIYAVVDPDNAIPELLENNNKASKQVPVTASSTISVSVGAVDTASFPVVKAKIGLRDADNNGINGLDETNFALAENGRVAAPLTITGLTVPEKHVRKVDIVFLVDTSDSMIEEWETVCGSIDDIVLLLAAQEIDVAYKIYGLSKPIPNLYCSTALTQGVYNGAAKPAHEEDWGPATTWAALNYPWRADAARIVIPISDENAYEGKGVIIPESQEDLQTIQEAVQASVSNNVTVYPFYSYNAYMYIIPGVKEEAEALANGTGGIAYLYENSNQVINDVVKSAKRSASDYLITYTSPDQTRDGSLRNIVVNAVYGTVSGAGAGQYLAPSDAKAEIAITSEMLSNNTPVPGDLVTITAEIRNLGGVSAQNVMVRFYDGDPSSGIQLGEGQVVPELSPAGSATLTAGWLATPGAHTINIVVDPLNTISESNENNNTALHAAFVPGAELPELGMSGNDIAISRSAPVRGDTLTIHATVHNMGAPAYNVHVSTYIGNPANGGMQIGSSTVPYLAAGGTATIPTQWTVDGPSGAYDIFVWIDPLNMIQEGNKNDNIAPKAVTIGEKLSATISTDKTQYSAATDIAIAVLVENNSDTLWSGTGDVYLEDKSGNRAATVSTFTVNNLKPAGLSGWSYRVPADLVAQWDMKDALVEVSVDLAQVLQGLGIAGTTIDTNSIRVLELDVNGNVLGEKRAQALFRTASAASVTWFADGSTPKDSTRYFSLYFDTTDHGTKEPSTNTRLPNTGRLAAFSDETGNIFVVDSNIDGTFGTPRLIDDVSTAIASTRGLILDDFNKDGFVDIVTGPGAIGEIYYYRNKADGSNTFSPRAKVGGITAGYYVMDMAGGDFDHDGNKDVIISGGAQNLLYLFKGKGDGTFTQSTLNMPSGAHQFHGMAATDVDQDGNIDLLVNSVDAFNVNAVYLYKGKADGTFLSPVPVSTSTGDSNGLASADFDEDSKADLIVNRNSGSAYFLKGYGDGTFGTPSLITTIKTATSAAYDTGDFNDDGHVDVIVASLNDVDFYPGDGRGGFGQKTPISTRMEIALGISSSPAIPEVHPVVGAAEAVPSQLFSFIGNTGGLPSGDYQVHVALSEGTTVLSDSYAPFTIMPDVNVTSTVITDKIAYVPNESVAITSTIVNRSLNHVFENLMATITIVSSGSNAPVFYEARSISSLVQGASISFNNYWNTGTFAPGTYLVTLEVKDVNGVVLAAATRSLTINSAVRPSAVLRGQISVDKQSLLSGETVTVSYSVTNAGNTDLSDVSFFVRIIHVKDLTVYDTITAHAPLAMSGTYSNTGNIGTTSYSAKDYLVVLQASIGGAEETIAGTYFRVEGAPTAPSLAGPANGSDATTFTPVLSVNNAADPNDDRITYEIELYADSGLAQLVTSGAMSEGGTGTTSWTVLDTLVENQTYYWRSRAYDGMLYSAWMDAASFRVNTVNDPPTAPIPTSPADNTSVDTLAPVLVVTNASDPDNLGLTYSFEISQDPDFTQTAASAQSIIAGEQGITSWQSTANLLENGWYYWRAQADDGLAAGPWSSPSRFFVNTANDAPTAPVVLAPLNNSEVTALASDIAVSNSTDPDSSMLMYFYEIDTVMTFDSAEVIRSVGIPEGQGTTSWSASGLMDNTTYYVRVKVSDGTAESPWSATVVFFANTANDAPTTPILANPSNGAGVNSSAPSLSINNSNDVDRDVLTYEFEVYNDPAMTSLTASSTEIAGAPQVTSWTVPVSLNENQTYYWRARAFDGEVYSTWMPAANFMVNTADDAPTAPVLLSPAEGGSVDTVLPTLTVRNATDPDSDRLTYDLEVYSNGTLITSFANMPQGSTGATSVTLNTSLTDNTVYQWRARAYDGERYGPWMTTATFIVHIPRTSIDATVDFDPDTLNKKSNGTWVVVYIELPAGYNPADIDISTVRLEGTVPAEARPTSVGDNDKDGIPDLMVKFKRSEVITVLSNGDSVSVHATGKAGEINFEGVDIIRVIP